MQSSHHLGPMVDRAWSHTAYVGSPISVFRCAIIEVTEMATHRTLPPLSRTSTFRSALKRSCLTVGVAATGVSCSWFSSAERERELPPLAIDVAEGEVITAQSQYFETGSANVSKDGIRYLEAVSEELVNSYESGEYTGPICIEGHSDSRGPTSQNMALSQRRADEVERILKGEKVENPITSVGKGESKAPTSTATRRPEE